MVTNSIQGRDRDVAADGVHVHRIAFPPPPKPPDGTSCVIQFNVCVLEAATQLLRRIGSVDLIHIHDWLVALAGRTLKEIIQRPLVLTIHDTAIGKHLGQLGPAEAYAAGVERWGCQESDEIICCSKYVRGELTQKYEAPAGRISIIPCGVSPERFKVDFDGAAFLSAFEAFGQTTDKLILYVGRLDKGKGVNVLIHAMKDVSKRCPDAKLVIVGKGALDGPLRQQAERLHLSDYVTFAGYRGGPVLSALLQAADVLVCPSLYEPFGIVALEGMVNGTPVVVSDTGGLAEIVDSEEVGVRIPSDDSAALAEAIVHVLTDEDFAKGIAAAGRERARTVYTWGRIAESTVRVYERATGQPKGAEHSVGGRPSQAGKSREPTGSGSSQGGEPCVEAEIEPEEQRTSYYARTTEAQPR